MRSSNFVFFISKFVSIILFTSIILKLISLNDIVVTVGVLLDSKQQWVVMLIVFLAIFVELIMAALLWFYSRNRGVRAASTILFAFFSILHLWLNQKNLDNCGCFGYLRISNRFSIWMAVIPLLLLVYTLTPLSTERTA